MITNNCKLFSANHWWTSTVRKCQNSANWLWLVGGYKIDLLQNNKSADGMGKKDILSKLVPF